MEVVVSDNLKWAKDPDILKEIGKEILYYSNKIVKINHFNSSQARFLVLTDESLYNFDKKKLKRKIEYKKIRGITYTTKSPEYFVIHGNEIEHDYYYQSTDRNLIINLISKFHEEQTGTPVKICEVNEKTLKSFVTSKKEKKKDSTFSRMDESKIIDTKKFLNENQIVDKTLRTASKSNIKEEKKIVDENPIVIKTTMIFCKEQKLEKATLENFKIIKIIGRGEYGKVFLVRFNNTNEYYAMKSVKKDYLEDKNEINTILIKKQIIKNLNFIFLTGCIACFQTEERLYFIMNLIKGEKFSDYLLNNKSKNENDIKFFGAIIGLTLEYLHKNGITNRNLLPDDIIIQEDGYLKISDFRICSVFNLKKNSIILKNSLEYTPPEEFTTKKNSKESDWWIYGIILYELFFGIPPFYSDDDSKMKDLIERSELRFPKDSKASKDAKDLITKLLIKNPDKRLGHNKDFEEIKNHEFFKGFDFKELINKKMKSNYCPKVGNIITDKEKIIEVSYEEYINSKALKVS